MKKYSGIWFLVVMILFAGCLVGAKVFAAQKVITLKFAHFVPATTMELELSEKGLPTGPVSRAVAGYLYFPVEAKIREDKRSRYKLECQLQGKRVVFDLKP